MSNFIDVNQLYRHFQDGPERPKVSVLNGVNFQLEQGEMAAIIGSSGSGKSTFLHCLAGLDKVDSGTVVIQGQDVSQLKEKQKAAWRNKTLGFIYQFHHLLSELTATENVALPLLIRGLKASEAHQAALALLHRIGLEHRAHHVPSQLSGGERQRVAIARAFVHQPALILADEPTGNLDEASAAQVLELMLELNQEYQTSFLVVTHDLQLAKVLPKQYVMTKGVLEPLHQELITSNKHEVSV